MEPGEPDFEREAPKTSGMGGVWTAWIGFRILGPILFLIGSANLRHGGTYVLPVAVGLFFGGLVSWFLADSIRERNDWSSTKRRVMTMVITVLGLAILPGLVFVGCGITIR